MVLGFQFLAAGRSKERDGDGRVVGRVGIKSGKKEICKGRVWLGVIEFAGSK